MTFNIRNNIFTLFLKSGIIDNNLGTNSISAAKWSVSSSVYMSIIASIDSAITHT